MTKKYHNQHTKVIHETATELFKSGTISEKEMEEYDDICLVKEVRQAKRGGGSGCPHPDSQKQTPKQMRQVRVSVEEEHREQTA